tara:strand:+ start:92 stop:217 length:126 start_codon:yes stop_codon:yes gene_type:complete
MSKAEVIKNLQMTLSKDGNPDVKKVIKKRLDKLIKDETIKK